MQRREFTGLVIGTTVLTGLPFYARTARYKTPAPLERYQLVIDMLRSRQPRLNGYQSAIRLTDGSVIKGTPMKSAKVDGLMAEFQFGGIVLSEAGVIKGLMLLTPEDLVIQESDFGMVPTWSGDTLNINYRLGFSPNRV